MQDMISTFTHGWNVISRPLVSFNYERFLPVCIWSFYFSEGRMCTQGWKSEECLRIDDSIRPVSGRRGVRRRVSQRPAAETATETPKPGPPTRTRPSQNPTPCRSPRPPPNWACAARCAPPRAAASAGVASQWRWRVSLAAAVPTDSPLSSVCRQEQQEEACGRFHLMHSRTQNSLLSLFAQ